VETAYNFDSVTRLGYQAARFDGVESAEYIGKLVKVYEEIRPTILILPFRGDIHSDHKHAFSGAFSIAKVFRFPSIKKIMMMEVLSETEFSDQTNMGFQPNLFINIKNYFDKKIEIMKIYKSELRDHPFPRSIIGIEALARLRGLTSGCEYAEAFMLIKEIDLS
jgi:LmbE family N-acetylglucosaminyl deacetylase